MVCFSNEKDRRNAIRRVLTRLRKQLAATQDRAQQRIILGDIRFAQDKCGQMGHKRGYSYCKICLQDV
jgi:hypothetical protein